MVADPNGTLFVSDPNIALVYEVSGGNLSVIAGGGSNAPSTTGQSPTSVQLQNPAGLALDSAGDLFVADSGTGEVYEIQAATGKLSVIAGGGSSAPTTTPSPATGLNIGSPGGIGFTSDGSLVIANSGAISTGPISSSGEVDLWSPSTGDLSVIAGGGSSQVTTTPVSPTSVNLSAPTGIAIDSAGDIYIADTYQGVVDELNASSGLISVIAGGGTNTPSPSPQGATSVSLSFPGGLALSPTGTLYVANFGQTGPSTVVQVSSGNLSVITGDGTGKPSTTPQPASSLAVTHLAGVALDPAGSLFVADPSGGKLYEIGAPAVPSLSPAQGSVLGGTTVQVTGGDFWGATAVDFGSAPAKSFTCSFSSCTAVSPPGSTGAVSVSVVTPLGSTPTGSSSQFTYDKASTSTTLKVSSPRATFGDEKIEKLSVTVSSRGTELSPSGTVTVPGTACSIKLSSGAGSCTLAADALGAGTAHLVAKYSGDSNFLGSSSSSVPLVVGKAPTVTVLKASVPSVVFGKENSETFTITVSSPGGAGTPTGTVRMSGTTCSKSLSRGKATCTLGAKQLTAGSRSFTATYQGSNDFANSTSKPVKIEVKSAKTTKGKRRA
jgi:sugar lactone lactonase YvrE